MRRLNLLESETARLLLENAQLKGANKKVRNAKQRHLAAQPRMKKECDDALAGLQEQRNINGDVRAALKTEQSGGPRMLTEMEYHQAKMYEDMVEMLDGYIETGGGACWLALKACLRSCLSAC